jgi:acetyltransferase
LGTKLLERLIHVGRGEGLERITATMLADNQLMTRLARRAGFHVQRSLSGSEYIAVLEL